MKKLTITTIFAATLMLLASFIKPPSKETTSFKVSGTCEMCKERIENALDVKGVRNATWNQSTQMVSVTYNPRKLEVKQLHNLVAIAGHDTELVKASEQAYADLPECCMYRSGAKCTDH